MNDESKTWKCGGHLVWVRTLKRSIRVEVGFKPKLNAIFTSLSLFHDIHLTVRGRGMGGGDPTIEQYSIQWAVETLVGALCYIQVKN